MKKRLLIAAAFLAHLPAFALDLTPHYREVTDEQGGQFRRLYFTDDDKKIAVLVDIRTTVLAEGSGTAFRFDDLQGATLSIQPSAQTPDMPFKDPSLAAYRTAAQSFAPKDVLESTAQGEGENPPMGDDWSSYSFRFAHKLVGTNLRQSVTFLNFNSKQQVVLITTAFSSEFDKAMQRSWEIVRNLRTMSEEELSTPAIN